MLSSLSSYVVSVGSACMYLSKREQVSHAVCESGFVDLAIHTFELHCGTTRVVNQRGLCHRSRG